MAEMAVQQAAPVEKAQRVEGLDAVRGFALLGILLMNICDFGAPGAAESNPTVWGGATGVNFWMWWIQYVFWSGKMRALFSMCFGAGVIYLTQRAEERGAYAGDVHYRRTLWLGVFGALHGALIWYGDILYVYAVASLLLYPLRKLSSWLLLTVGLAQVAYLCGGAYFDAKEKEELREKAKGLPANTKLAKEQAEAKSSWDGFVKDWQPTPTDLEKELKAYRGSYAEATAYRVQTISPWHSQSLYSPGYWDFFSMMLIGMALAKWGVFAGAWRPRTYALVAVLGIGIGATVSALSANYEATSNFDGVAAMYGYTTYQFHRLFIGVGYLAAIVGMVKAGWLKFLTTRLAAVGQMAFTNYIMHSVICTLFFYGYGFGWYGKLERHQLYYVVVTIWVVQLMVSPIWLRHYRFGPLEWCWRSLTYWQRQPMRLAAISEPALPAEIPA